MPATRPRPRSTDTPTAKPRTDAYVGLLGISLVALVMAMLFGYLSYSSISETPPKVAPFQPRQTPGAGGPAGGQMGGIPPGAQMGGQPGAQMGGQPGAQMGGRPPGAQMGGQPPGAQMGGRPPGGMAGGGAPPPRP